MPTAKRLISDGKQTLKKTYHYWREHGSKETILHAADVFTERPLPPVVAQPLEEIWRRRFPALSALPTYTLPRPAPRLNLVLASLNDGPLEDGAATALLLAALAAETLGCALRIITRRDRPSEQRFAELVALAQLERLGNVEFKWVDEAAALPKVELEVGENELFLTTSWQTTWSTRQGVAPARIIYLVQTDERLRHAYGDEQLWCREVLQSTDLTFLVRSESLFAQLRHEGFAHIAQHGTWFAPAPCEAAFFVAAPGPDAPRRQLLLHAPPDGALFYRGLQALQRATASGILSAAHWDLHLLGRGIPPLALWGGGQPQRHESLSWPQYAALVRRTDLGLCLTSAPPPSQPALELLASGAVVVTNHFGSTPPAAQLGKTLICVAPSVDELVGALAQAVPLLADRALPAPSARPPWRESFADAVDTIARKFSPG